MSPHQSRSEAELMEWATKLDHKQKLVLDHMSEGEVVESIAQTAADAGVPLKDTREILKGFKEMEIAVFTTLVNVDEPTKMHGRGYFRSSFGEQLIGFIRSKNLW